MKTILFITVFLNIFIASAAFGDPIAYFNFSDLIYTKLSDAWNSVPMFKKFNRDWNRSSTTGNGNFRVRKDKSPNESYVNIPDVTEGTIYAYVEISNWLLSGDPDEVMSFSFSEYAYADQKVAGIWLNRFDENIINIIGKAGGYGENIYESYPIYAVNVECDDTGPLALLLEVDLDKKTYTVWHSEGYGMIELGTRAIDHDFTVGAFEMNFSGDFNDKLDLFTTDFVDIDTIIIGTALDDVGVVIY